MSARWLVSVVLFAGCGHHGASATCNDGTVCPTVCGAGVDAPPLEGQQHIAEPTPITYQANPPASGPHWPLWQMPWGIYANELPRERWVHNLEHGGIVMLYNCPSGCDDVVAQLTNIRDATPADKFNEQRFIITPDTVMPHKVAVLAWGWRWQGQSVDAGTIHCFIDARYDHAPESIP